MNKCLNDKIPTLNVAFVFSFINHLVENFPFKFIVGCCLIIRLKFGEFHSKLFGRLSYNSASYETSLHIHYVDSMDSHFVGFNLLSTN